MKKMYELKGMTCSMCKASIERTFQKIDGYQVVVNLLENKMMVEAEQIDEQFIIETIDRLGYTVVLDERQKQNKYKFTLSIVLLILLMYFSMGSMLGFYMFQLSKLQQGWIQLLLCLLVFYLQKEYLISGFKALRNMTPTMESLVTISTCSSFVYSIYVMYTWQNGQMNHHLYFETGAMILVIVAIGKFLESKHKLETTSAIAKLIQLKIKQANRLVDGEMIKTDVRDLKPNDVIVVKAGEAIALDGFILSGQAEIDESMINGETKASFKSVGDFVVGGTLNLNGYLMIKVSVDETQSVLSSIITSCQTIANKKLPIERFVDRVSSVFVPGIIVLSIVVFGIWYWNTKNFETAFNFALATLTVSCPCALGLATPSAIVVATGMLSKEGILLKDPAILEKAYQLQCLVVDKTGTLTENKLKVIENTIAQVDLEVLLAMEKQSNHPVAQSIVQQYPESRLSITDWKELAGLGIEANYLGSKYLVGNEKILFQEGVLVNKDEVANILNQGYTTVFLIKDNQLVGYLLLEDQLKASSFQAIQQFKDRNIDVLMCTGDQRKVALKVAEKLGLTHFYSEVSPHRKYQVVVENKQKRLTAMVGDGINDAIALSAADISFALSSGTDISHSSSSVLLMKNDLRDIAYFVDVSKKTIQIIRQNLFWALFYNSLLIPIAAGVFHKQGIHLDPMFAAFMMSFSSILVLTNALRIQKIKKEGEINMILKIKGMMCSHCEASVERIFKKHNLQAKANKDSGTVEFSGVANLEVIKQELSEFGYQLEINS